MNRKIVGVDGSALEKLREERSLLCDTMFLEELAKKGKKITLITLRKYMASVPENPHVGYRSVLDKMAAVLRCDPSALALRQEQSLAHAPLNTPCLEGSWKAWIKDQIVPPYFELAVEPKKVDMIVRIRQQGTNVVIKGRFESSRTEEYVFQGKLRDGGNYLVGCYEVSTHCRLGFGTATMRKLTIDHEDILEGFYVGRGTMHGPQLIFGTIKIKFESELTTEDRAEHWTEFNAIS